MPVLERMRPLLGTFVTIRAASAESMPTAVLMRAIDAAFDAMSRVDRRMSIHRPSSDICRINRARAGTRLRVDRWTHGVLRRAETLRRASRGAFDLDVGDSLSRAGLLPAKRGRSSRRHGDGLPAFRLLPGHHVLVRRRLHIDLGGIAKGFAVDRAVDALRAAGVLTGTVNAGGDLRVFGSGSAAIRVRDDASPTRTVGLGMLREGAVATTAAYFVAKSGERRSAVVDPHRDRRVRLIRSICVVARHCVDADALTKVVAVDRRMSAALARRFHARVVRS